MSKFLWCICISGSCLLDLRKFSSSHFLSGEIFFEILLDSRKLFRPTKAQLGLSFPLYSIRYMPGWEKTSWKKKQQQQRIVLRTNEKIISCNLAREFGPTDSASPTSGESNRNGSNSRVFPRSNNRTISKRNKISRSSQANTVWQALLPPRSFTLSDLPLSSLKIPCSSCWHAWLPESPQEGRPSRSLFL